MSTAPTTGATGTTTTIIVIRKRGGSVDVTEIAIIVAVVGTVLIAIGLFAYFYLKRFGSFIDAECDMK